MRQIARGVTNPPQRSEREIEIKREIYGGRERGIERKRKRKMV